MTNLKTFEKNFLEDHKDSSFVPASEIMDDKPKLVSITPRLDLALNGGIPEGSRVLFAGKESTGKTTLAMEVVKNAQQMGKPTILVAAEGRFRQQTATCVEGVDPDQLMIIRSSKGDILTGEDMLTQTANAIRDIEGAVIVLDSLSFIYPGEKMEEDVSGMNRPGAPKMISDFLSKVSNIIPIQKTIFIMIAHTYSGQDRYSGINIKGGNAARQQSDIILRCKKMENWEEEDEVIGKIVEWMILKTAIGAPYSGGVQTFLRFGTGFDITQEIFSLATDSSIIHKGGSWYTIHASSGDIKKQGQFAALNFLRDNPEVFADIKKQVMDMIK